MSNIIITLLTTLISVFAGVIAAILTTFYKTILDKETHRSNKFYEYSAAALKEIYEEVRLLEIMLSKITKKDQIYYDEFDKFNEEIQRFYNIWSKNEIYLMESSNTKLKRLDRFIRHTRVEIIKITKLDSSEMPDWEYESSIKSKLNELDDLLETKMPMIRDEIKNEFKMLLMK